LKDDLLIKMDGFSGGDPDDDWIVDPHAQIELYSKVQKLIETLENFSNEFTEASASNQTLTPQNFDISQNYPNPFNPVTTIRYQLPEERWVTLRIYNVLGQLVRTLVDQQQPAGYYTVRWSGRDNNGRLLSSGIHFYRLQAGEYVVTRKMLFIK